MDITSCKIEEAQLSNSPYKFAAGGESGGLNLVLLDPKLQPHPRPLLLQWSEPFDPRIKFS